MIAIFDMYDNLETHQYEGIPRITGKTHIDTRVFHSLTRLGSKNILILGGHDEFGALSTGARLEEIVV